MWGMLSSALKIVSSLLGFAKSRDDRVDGRNEQKLADWNRRDAAKKRMDRVAPPDVEKTVGKLRNGGL